MLFFLWFFSTSARWDFLRIWPKTHGKNYFQSENSASGLSIKLGIFCDRAPPVGQFCFFFLPPSPRIFAVQARNPRHMETVSSHAKYKGMRIYVDGEGFSDSESSDSSESDSSGEKYVWDVKWEKRRLCKVNAFSFALLCFVLVWLWKRSMVHFCAWR